MANTLQPKTMRMSLKATILTMLVAVLCACGDGTPKPKSLYNGVLEVKGLKLGMSESEVAGHVKGLKAGKFDRPQSSSYKKLTCKTRYTDDPDGCHFTLANRPVESAELYFISDQLGDMLVKFEDKYFETVNVGLTEKFGNPYSEERTPLKNRLTGSESSYVVKIWASGKGRGLILTNHDRNGDSYLPRGVLQLVDRNFNDAREADSTALGGKPDKKDI